MVSYHPRGQGGGQPEQARWEATGPHGWCIGWPCRLVGTPSEAPLHLALFHWSGAGDCTCIPTRRTCTLDSLKLLFCLWKLDLEIHTPWLGGRGIRGAERDGVWQGEGHRGVSLRNIQAEISQVFIKCAKYKPHLPTGTTYTWYSPLLREEIYTLCTHTHVHSYTSSHNWYWWQLAQEPKVPLLAGSLSV